ncbi:MAG: uracil-DNA glycosylase [Desulfobacterales bacterium]|nr:uracil-DNA glycosylase [Desulfobacterales bacterium]
MREFDRVKDDSDKKGIPASLAAPVLEDVKHYLRFLEAIGCTGIGAGEKGREIAGKWGPGEKTGGEDLAALKKNIGNCRRCRLADQRKAVVFGSGNPRARLMFIGAFPEAEDENTGIAYSGNAGALLTRIIEAIGETRESVYICHAVKCRPASDRLPDRFEARACRSCLERQIESVSPEMICVLGGFAAQSLLKTDEPISRIRGRFHEYAGIPVMPTHEPAYLLVHPAAKRAVWEDMKKVMARISH